MWPLLHSRSWSEGNMFLSVSSLLFSSNLQEQRGDHLLSEGAKASRPPGEGRVSDRRYATEPVEQRGHRQLI